MNVFQKFIVSFTPTEPGYGFMWMLLLVFVFALALILERGVFLLRRASFKPNAFMGSIIGCVQKEQVDEALKICDRNGKMALAQVVLAGLKNIAGGAEKIKNSIEEATLNVVPVLEKRTGYLAMIGNVATLIGLMGTIYGLILSFAAVGSPGIDPAEKSTLLAQGISAAMNTTLAGLAIAIPCIMIFTFYHSKTQKIIDDIDEHSLKLVNILTERSYKVHKYHIGAMQLKDGVGIHVTHNNIKIFTDNKLVKEITI
ncbi:MAG: hypothetical protein A2268_04180 [Candidatus Raymondbacteria bacterium RifOxyA12_full_50_37]|uniref:MotA/TolQ/ExbB proton channel domain-containing protein n=1 Tax=Candidatus Raymondbacteria bacterium RIFOXYD12_FULL_49_13 TaxID=1817890 RepID=A0A1F7FB97_UNCRA|nr:MAG: hypothetical protein A2268_04180 [Candidatus Raymondbacteria bacterium RifOxyA12_full_50_37]OGJ92578.1 MAG: hypothetical protein A2248_05770 [Candidatus Raymondbacteria bacterium RIFOXYA2_FULL_49_16]OGJ92860.1 MAG: hypothetical protein A2350_16800 [Candidatus Raymondbacteria bacterium RifOxyB12_full_50_8]OGJ97932.1 MAG: hypothetical protein A2453_02795 [Candidatus Raymondbacteria bacterium RIFOXYC2_FULL_50_21]OGK03954.1 MAG: hypothetical protein A2519_04490 [Candidatus Raymondbacteria b